MKAVRETVLEAFVKQTNIPPLKLRVPDRWYTLPSVREVRDHMEDFAVLPYETEKNDCDNRACRLTAHFSGKGYAFAWVSIGIHDICAFVSDNKQVWFVEPSTCLIYPPDVPLTWGVIP